MQKRRMMALTVVFSAILGLSLAHAATQKFAYPTADEPSFTLEAPESWTMTPAESEGDYFYLETESGAQLAFRTIPAKTDKQIGKVVEEAATETAEYLTKYYDDVKISDAEDDNISGCEGAYATGSGTDKESGDEMGFGFGWYILPDQKVVEIWFAVRKGDEDAGKEAEKILRSFSVPGK
jgi:hypothetical protein